MQAFGVLDCCSRIALLKKLRGFASGTSFNNGVQ
jgi:hypothetical protein